MNRKNDFFVDEAAVKSSLGNEPILRILRTILVGYQLPADPNQMRVATRCTGWVRIECGVIRESSGISRQKDVSRMWDSRCPGLFREAVLAVDGSLDQEIRIRRCDAHLTQLASDFLR